MAKFNYPTQLCSKALDGLPDKDCYCPFCLKNKQNNKKLEEALLKEMQKLSYSYNKGE